MGALTRSFFGHLAFFFCARRPWEPKWLPRPSPRASKTSPSLDFHRFLVDFGRLFNDFLYHVSYFLSGLLHYFLSYLELAFSNFRLQVRMCWGRPQGSTRSQKNTMWPIFCLACLFVFVTSSPTFQDSGHRFVGVVSRVISELRSTARRRECRRQVDMLKSSLVLSRFNLNL